MHRNEVRLQRAPPSRRFSDDWEGAFAPSSEPLRAYEPIVRSARR